MSTKSTETSTSRLARAGASGASSMRLCTARGTNFERLARTDSRISTRRAALVEGPIASRAVVRDDERGRHRMEEFVDGVPDEPADARQLQHGRHRGGQALDRLLRVVALAEERAVHEPLGPLVDRVQER